MGVAFDITGNLKSIMIVIVTPLITLLPDIIIKQINYNLFPTPSEYLENFRGTTEFIKINNSESRFIKNISNMQSDIGQKIELVSLDDNKRLFEKKNRAIVNVKKTFNKNESNGSNPNSYNSENSNIPLIDSFHKKDRINYINESNKRIEELNSEKIRSDENQENNSKILF